MGEGLKLLSPEAIANVKLAFDSFDIDHSDAIDITECLKHWKGGFGKISAREFLKTVDMDGNGEIEYDEFERFWQVVKDAGHSEEDICEELNRIKNGESWVGFSNLPIQYQAKNTETMRVKDKDAPKDESNDNSGGVRF